jgi:hypothetical protein
VTRANLEAEILDWIGTDDWRPDESRFERLALELFRFQFDHCEPYALYARAMGRTPESVSRANEIPAVPTGAFKEFDLRCFDAEATIQTFRTSGTATEQRGQLHLDTLALYDASLLASLRRCLLADLAGTRPTMRFLAPSPNEAEDSSLSYMFDALRVAEGSPESGFDLHEGRLDLASLGETIRRARERAEPLVLAGTSFAFVHLLDSFAAPNAPNTSKADWALPAGSRLMETGGFKGRSREVPREVLRTALAEFFSIPEPSIVNQYGMTELGSQFYDSTLLDPSGPRRKLVPPWTRVRFVDPESGQDVDGKEVGMVLIHDLANTGSIAAIQTADLGRSIVDSMGKAIGFDILGRAAGAEARGCSVATDVMLEAAGEASSNRTGDAG